MNWSLFLAEAWNARANLLAGLSLTALSSVGAVLLGTMLGIVVGLALTYGHAINRFLARLYTDIIRGIPLFVLIMAIYYVQAAAGLGLGAFQAGTLALAIFCASHVAENLRGALQAIPKGQTEAAQSIGLTFLQCFFSVLLPQALRQMLPAWVNTAIEIVKGTTLLSVIGVAELLLTTQRVISRTYLSLEFYLFVGFVFFLLNFVLEQLGRALERRLARSA